MVNMGKKTRRKKKIFRKTCKKGGGGGELPYTPEQLKALEREKVEEVDAKELADAIYSNDINQVNKIIDRQETYLSLKNVLNRPIARKGSAWGYYSPKSALERAEGKSKTKIKEILDHALETTNLSHYAQNGKLTEIQDLLRGIDNEKMKIIINRKEWREDTLLMFAALQGNMML